MCSSDLLLGHGIASRSHGTTALVAQNNDQRHAENARTIFDGAHGGGVNHIAGIAGNEDFTDIQTTENSVRITMTLTTPGCGMAREIALNAKHTVIRDTQCDDVLVTVTFDPPWDRSRISDEGKKILGL